MADLVLRAPDGAIRSQQQQPTVIVTAQTAAEMERWAKGEQDHPAVRAWAVEACRRADDCREPGERAARAMAQLLRERATFVPGPLTVQLLQTPGVFLAESGPAGNCADFSMALGAMLLSVGMDPRLVRLGHGRAEGSASDPYEHVIVALEVPGSDGKPGLLFLDPTVPEAQVAPQLQAAHAARSLFVHQPIGRDAVQARSMRGDAGGLDGAGRSDAARLGAPEVITIMSHALPALAGCPVCGPPGMLAGPPRTKPTLGSRQVVQQAGAYYGLDREGWWRYSPDQQVWVSVTEGALVSGGLGAPGSLGLPNVKEKFLDALLPEGGFARRVAEEALAQMPGLDLSSVCNQIDNYPSVVAALQIAKPSLTADDIKAACRAALADLGLAPQQTPSTYTVGHGLRLQEWGPGDRPKTRALRGVADWRQVRDAVQAEIAAGKLRPATAEDVLGAWVSDLGCKLLAFGFFGRSVALLDLGIDGSCRWSADESMGGRFLAGRLDKVRSVAGRGAYVTAYEGDRPSAVAASWSAEAFVDPSTRRIVLIGTAIQPGGGGAGGKAFQFTATQDYGQEGAAIAPARGADNAVQAFPGFRSWPCFSPAAPDGRAVPGEGAAPTGGGGGLTKAALIAAGLYALSQLG